MLYTAPFYRDISVSRDFVARTLDGPLPILRPAYHSAHLLEWGRPTKSFLKLSRTGGPEPYTVLLNWQTGLKK